MNFYILPEIKCIIVPAEEAITFPSLKTLSIIKVFRFLTAKRNYLGKSFFVHRKNELHLQARFPLSCAVGKGIIWEKVFFVHRKNELHLQARFPLSCTLAGTVPSKLLPKSPKFDFGNKIGNQGSRN